MSWILAVATPSPSPSPSPSTSGTGWQDILKAVAPAVTAAVAVIAGAFAYAKFLRGRTFRPVAMLMLSACEVKVWDQPALRVDVSVKNSGLTALRMDEDYSQRVDVFLANEATWEAAAISPEKVVLWHQGGDPHRSVDFFLESGLLSYSVPRYRGGQLPDQSDKLPRAYRLEAGQEATRSLLVPVDPAPAYLVLVTFQACPHASWWSWSLHRRCRAKKRPPDQWHTRTVVSTQRQQTDQGGSSGTTAARQGEHASGAPWQTVRFMVDRLIYQWFRRTPRRQATPNQPKR
jgi:hypothetical protein